MTSSLHWWRTQVMVHAIAPAGVVLWAAGMPADARAIIDISSVPYHVRRLMVPGFICHAEAAMLPGGGRVFRKWEMQ